MHPGLRPVRSLDFAVFWFGGVEFGGLASGDAQGLPLGPTKMFALIENLSHMIGGMHHAAIDRLQNCMRFLTDVHGARKVFRLERLELAENCAPALFPALHQV